jgi:hypothetical protein
MPGLAAAALAGGFAGMWRERRAVEAGVRARLSKSDPQAQLKQRPMGLLMS